MIKNKKAQGLSLTTIIVAILVLLVLVVVALVFTGALGDFAQRIREFFASKECVRDIGGDERPAETGCEEDERQYVGFVKMENEGHICCVPKET
jgi:hypothetical protein